MIFSWMRFTLFVSDCMVISIVRDILRLAIDHRLFRLTILLKFTREKLKTALKEVGVCKSSCSSLVS